MKNVSNQKYRRVHHVSNSTRPYTSEGNFVFETVKPYSHRLIEVGAYQYKEEDILGKGFSSNVYKCRSIKEEEKEFAIKVIDLKKFKTSNLKLIENEILVHKNLNHPNILKCYDVYRNLDFFYIITEYCPHGDLMTFMKQKRKVQEQTVVHILEQILVGYRYLSERGIIHRDLKPANILRSGDKWKIGDFGFAIICKEQKLFDTFNVGTPLYMSLESLKQNKYSIKTDIFAIGVIAYEMLTGKTPWESKNQKELVQKMKSMKAKEPFISRQIKLQQFIMKAIEVDESVRWGREVFDYFLPTTKYTQKMFEKPLKIKKLIKIRSQNCPLNATSSIDLSSNQKVPSNTPTESPMLKNVQYFIHKNVLETSTEVSENDSNTHLDEIIKQNTQKLFNQLQLYRLVYYMIKNIDCFLISDQNRKEILMISLLKYLIRGIKELEDQRINNNKLKLWEIYKSSKAYIQIHMDIKGYCLKYERQYSTFLKCVEIEQVRKVNREFPQLTAHTIPLTTEFFRKYLSFLSQYIRTMNHDIMRKFNENQGYIHGLTHHIQAFQSLYNFHKALLDKNIRKGGSIGKKVVVDYRKNNMTSDRYFQLRGKARFI